MIYFIWLAWLAVIGVIDASGVAYDLPEFLVAILGGFGSLVGFVLMLSAYGFLAEKLDSEVGSENSDWRTAAVYVLLLGPAFLLFYA